MTDSTIEKIIEEILTTSNCYHGRPFSDPQYFGSQTKEDLRDICERVSLRVSKEASLRAYEEIKQEIQARFNCYEERRTSKTLSSDVALAYLAYAQEDKDLLEFIEQRRRSLVDDQSKTV